MNINTNHVPAIKKESSNLFLHKNWSTQSEENNIYFQINHTYARLFCICSNPWYVFNGPYSTLKIWDTRDYPTQELFQMNIMPFVHWKIKRV